MEYEGIERHGRRGVREAGKKSEQRREREGKKIKYMRRKRKVESGIKEEEGL